MNLREYRRFFAHDSALTRLGEQIGVAFFQSVDELVCRSIQADRTSARLWNVIVDHCAEQEFCSAPLAADSPTLRDNVNATARLKLPYLPGGRISDRKPVGNIVLETGRNIVARRTALLRKD